MRFGLKAFLVGIGMMALGMMVFMRLTRPIIVHTGAPLDLAIVGKGYFELVDWQTYQTAYTRCGEFEVDANGQIRLRGTDFLLQPEMFVPEQTEVSVSPYGDFRARGCNTDDVDDIGQISLCLFRKPDCLKRMGWSIFVSTEESGMPDSCVPGQPEVGLIAVGWLEQRGLFDERLPFWLAWSLIATVLVLMLIQISRVLRHVRGPAHASERRGVQ